MVAREGVSGSVVRVQCHSGPGTVLQWSGYSGTVSQWSRYSVTPCTVVQVQCYTVYSGPGAVVPGAVVLVQLYPGAVYPVPSTPCTMHPYPITPGTPLPVHHTVYTSLACPSGTLVMPGSCRNVSFAKTSDKTG